MEPFSAYDTVNKILEGHRLAHYDFQQTVNLLQSWTIPQPEQMKQEIFEALWSAFATESLVARPARGHIIPSIHAVVIRSIAEFGPTAELPSRIFALLRWDNPAAMDFWAQNICHQFSYSMFHNANRFEQQALSLTRNLCSNYTSERASELMGIHVPPSVVAAAKDVEKTIEHIEYSRFAATIRGAHVSADTQPPELDRLLSALGLPDTVATAMREAEKYLGSQALFDPKHAAGLVRASIDEIHKAVVAELQNMTGRQCEKPEKDGGRRAYMRDVGFISQPEEVFFSGIYTLVSVEGAHKLVAERESVLFIEQVVKYYLRLLLRRLLAQKTAPAAGHVP